MIKRIKQWWNGFGAEPPGTPQLRSMQPRLKLTVNARTRAITEKELAARYFAAPGSPLFEALVAVVEQKILAHLDAAMDQAPSDRDHRWHLAAADALTELRDDLRDREAAAREAAAREEREMTEKSVRTS